MNIVEGTSEIGGSTAEIEESQSRVDSTANIVGPLRRTCFTADDLTVIEAQRNFERIIPEREKVFKSLNDTAIKKQISFFTALEQDTVQAIENPKIKELVGLALANTVGGYLYGYYVPIMKHSYYGGFVSYSSAIEVIRLLRKYQNVIGVHGEGSITSQSWELLELDQKPFFERIAPITNAELHNASHNCHDGSGLHLIPSLEIDVETNELLLISFSRHHHNGYVANPRSKNASQAVLQHYIHTVKCLEGKREPLDTFNQAISAWLAKNMGHILSNQTTLLYPAFEGMLKIVKTIENGQNLLKQSAAVENLDPDETYDDDFSILADGPDEEERRLTSMSIGQKISIWVGCSLTVLLVVYILFKLRHNRKIISNNRLTHRRGKSVSVRSRRASRRRMPRSVSEEEEVTLFDRQEVDTNADDGMSFKF
uniref:Uncharacterized protein n=1 Tax=Anopheles atroparvus TaxID=41427 RepID=A0A182J5B3_ANOAO